MESAYLIKRRQLKQGVIAKDPPKERQPIARQSEKKKKELAEEKKNRSDEDPLKEQWFKARRKDMVGTCQCGCGQASRKKDDLYFRHSAAHVFPKRDFESVMYHPLNFVERAFWGGCHSNMDDTSMDKWPNMADWEDIKGKFHALAPLLTDEERANKFYNHLEKLVYSKK